MNLVYRYQEPSAVRGDHLALSTFRVLEGRADHPWFFEGALIDPRTTARFLVWLGGLVASRFYMPLGPSMLDPVVTSAEGTLRFEGFSSCAGVYGRVDLGAAALDASRSQHGTTNVDMGTELRAMLSRLGRTEAASLSVGRDALAVADDRGRAVERRVKLPRRWLRGFVEVQSIQHGLRPVAELSGGAARAVFASLRPGRAKQVWHLVPHGRGFRWSHQDRDALVSVRGLERLTHLRPLLRGAERLRIHAGDDGCTGWVVDHATARATAVLSPSPARGLSGEGQALSALASERWQDAVAAVRGQLRWQRVLDTAELAARTGVDAPTLEASLAALGTHGLVGFDLAEGTWFHRELPFDASTLASLHPRWRNARALLADGGVRDGGDGVWWVRSGDKDYRVRLTDRPTCTCTWWSKHRGERGPCKHVLAALQQKDRTDGTG